MRNRRAPGTPVRPELEEMGAYRVVSGPYAGMGPRGHPRDWSSVRDEVCERLADDGEVDASDIEVEVQDGIVTLRGTVADRHQKRRAEHLADGVARVSDVYNELRLVRAAGTVGGSGVGVGLEVNGTDPGSH